jgi:[protein-PII] uridylyltransferase
MQLCEKTLFAMHTIDITTQIFLKKLTSSFFYDAKNLSCLKKNRLEKGIYYLEGKIFANKFKKPTSLLNLLRQLSSYDGEELSYDISFIDYARKCSYSKINSPSIYKAFKNLLYNSNIYATFVMLYDAKLLEQLIKPLKHVLNLPQFDGYHEYPVDKHSILGLYHLENIKSPFIKALYDDLCGEGKALIKLVVLLHDIGKGRSADHSELGAVIFKAYAAKLHFSEEAIKSGTILIKYHTLMSSIATKEDIYSEDIILSFITKIEDIKILKLLYILTYCDLNSVGRGIYTNFNSRLLRELYNLSAEMFDKKELIGETKRRLRRESSLKKYKEFLELPKILQRKTLQIASNLFFIKHKPYEIVEIVNIAKEDAPYKFKIENELHLSISIIKSINFNLGYLLGKLSFLDLINMEIFKLFDGKKYFKIEFNETINPDEIGYLHELIKDSFDMSKTTTLCKPIILANEIELDCEHSKSYAKMTINAKNQKGMMAYMMSIFDQEGIDVANAKILTIKNRARNLILIEKKINLCKDKEKILKFFI